VTIGVAGGIPAIVTGRKVKDAQELGKDSPASVDNPDLTERDFQTSPKVPVKPEAQGSSGSLLGEGGG